MTDVDDEVARFERAWYRYEVAENLPGGTAVGRVHAADADLPPFDRFHYRLVQLDSLSSPASNNASQYTSALYARSFLSVSYIQWRQREFKVGGTSLVSRLSTCLTEANWWRLIAE